MSVRTNIDCGLSTDHLRCERGQLRDILHTKEQTLVEILTQTR